VLDPQLLAFDFVILRLLIAQAQLLVVADCDEGCHAPSNVNIERFAAISTTTADLLVSHTEDTSTTPNLPFF
jgi:hypothetical protein